jgi:endonuclease/exonuclease/phosphatase (EEP) superfamily protein YafD
MVKQTFFCIVAILLLAAGCVRIPEHHGTAGKYNELSDINTECFSQDATLSFNPLAANQQADELNARNFVVLNWNSYKGKKKGWQEDFDRLSSQSDLVIMQEGHLNVDLQDLLNKRQYKWDIAKAFIYRDTYHGVLTASRIKPDFLCSLRQPEPLSGIPKTVLITRYPLANTVESLVVANVHMINFSLDIAAYRAQLTKIAEIVAQHQGPLIVAGDFNSWNTARQSTLAEFMQELDLRQVGFEDDKRVTFMGQNVDHIFYKKLLPIEAFTEKVTTSDHNPMLVTFRLTDD